MADIPAEDTAAHTQWANALTGLAWAGHRAAREMNIFLAEANDMHRFPATWEQIKTDDDVPSYQVRESAAVYAIQ